MQLSTVDLSGLEIGGQSMNAFFPGGEDIPVSDLESPTPAAFDYWRFFPAPAPATEVSGLETMDPSQLMADAAGNIVDPSTGAVVLTAAQLAASGTDQGTVATGLEQSPSDASLLAAARDVEGQVGGGTIAAPGVLDKVKGALGTKLFQPGTLGALLASLGLGAAGLGIAGAVGGGGLKYQVPQPPQTAGQQAVSGYLSTPGGAKAVTDVLSGTLADPVTKSLQKDLLSFTDKGVTTDPTLLRKFREEKDVLQNRMFTALGPQWEMSTPGIDASTKLQESQDITSYQDWLNTIGLLSSPYYTGTGLATRTATDLGGVSATNQQAVGSAAAQEDRAWLAALERLRARTGLGTSISDIFGRAAKNAFSLAA